MSKEDKIKLFPKLQSHLSPILSTATLTFRESIRSHLVLALAAVIAIITYGIPRMIKSDGIVYAHNTIFYTLIISFTFISIAAMWTSASAISSETKAKTLQLARVKPIRMWKLWLGKWLGLTTIFALISLFALFNVWLQVRNIQEYKIADERIPPILPSIEEQIDLISQDAKAQGKTEEEIEEIISTARAMLPYATDSLKHGENWKFNFHSQSPLPQYPSSLLLKFESGAHSASIPIIGIAAMQSNHSTNDLYTNIISNMTMREMKIKLSQNGENVLEGANDIQVIIQHLGDEKSAPILLQPRQHIFILSPGCSLETNFFRAFIILLSIITLLIAVGLTLGSLFSLPVSIFCATCLILSAFVTNYTMTDPNFLDPPAADELSFTAKLTQKLSAASSYSIHFIATTAITPSPIKSLSESEQISAKSALQSFAANALFLPLLLMLFSSMSLNKKELSE